MLSISFNLRLLMLSTCCNEHLMFHPPKGWNIRGTSQHGSRNNERVDCASLRGVMVALHFSRRFQNLLGLEATLKIPLDCVADERVRSRDWLRNRLQKS